MLSAPPRLLPVRRRLHDDGVPAVRGPKGGRRHVALSRLPTFNELPIRYHAHVRLALNATEWWNVRMVHAIAQFAGRGWHIPKNITGRLRYF